MSPLLTWESSNDHKHIYAKRWLKEKKTLSPFWELYGPSLFKVESPSRKKIGTKFGCSWLSGSGEE